MQEKIHQTQCGTIHYWCNKISEGRQTLVFLPGLTADHRLFEPQLSCFQNEYNVFVWDAPGHSASRPFVFDFNLTDKARWLDEILEKEGAAAPIIIGQSMGGYLGQVYAQLFPQKLAGFIFIDSAPLQRKYMTSAELWFMKRMEPVYRYYPWKSLLKAGSNGVATSEYGRELMRSMMLSYTNQKDYAKLAGHGFRIIAEAIEADLPYKIPCPALLICGEVDQAGYTCRYNRNWHKETGLPLKWIKGAGHNSNTDRPEEINALIKEFAEGIKK